MDNSIFSLYSIGSEVVKIKQYLLAGNIFKNRHIAIPIPIPFGRKKPQRSFVVVINRHGKDSYLYKHDTYIAMLYSLKIVS